MKKNIQYIFKQLWFLIVLLIIAILLEIFGQAQNQCGGFFDAYFKFSCFVIIIGFIFMFVGSKLPRKFNIDSFPFTSYSWEKDGRFYRQTLKIESWKDVVMDVSKADFGLIEKKVSKPDSDSVDRLIQETCVAEITHLALIFVSPFLLLLLSDPWQWFFMIVYCLANGMYILIQRYNRPRLKKVLVKINSR